MILNNMKNLLQIKKIKATLKFHDYLNILGPWILSFERMLNIPYSFPKISIRQHRKVLSY